MYNMADTFVAINNLIMCVITYIITLLYFTIYDY